MASSSFSQILRLFTECQQMVLKMQENMAESQRILVNSHSVIALVNAS